MLAAAATVLLVTSLASSALADTASSDYVQRLGRARALVLEAQHGDTSAALQAASQADTGDPANDAVVADLREHPPDLVDALQRLESLTRAAQATAPSGDPQVAQAKLRSVLAEPRFQEAPPSLLDQLRDFLLRLLAGLASLFGAGGSGLAVLIELAVLLAVLGALALVAVQVWRGRAGRSAAARPGRLHDHPAGAADRFAEADRRAAAGDYSGALLALTGAVATALGGESAWEASPLTVRELFGRRAVIEPLRPLLIPFEGVAYGRRRPTADTYAEAAMVAAPYRVETAGAGG